MAMGPRPGRSGSERKGEDRGARKGFWRPGLLWAAGCWTARVERGRDTYCVVVENQWSSKKVHVSMYPWEFWESLTMESRSEIARRLIARATEALKAPPGGHPCSDVELEKDCPVFAAFMTYTGEAGKKQRRTATLTVFFEDGVFKAVLKDREEDRSLWASCDTLTGLLGTLEERLNADPVEWRRSGSPPGGPVRK
jgi:hypothetical protein